jgi:LysM repeat protein
LGGFVLALCLLPILSEAATAPPSATTGGPGAAAETPYVVKRGDTLWGISRDLLEDPLLWRSLWERNKFIVDPNRIYPGDQLSLPGKELAPAPAAAPAPAPAPVAEAPKPEPPKPEPVAPEPPKEKAEAPAPPPVAPPPIEEKRAPEPPVPPASQYARVCSPVLVSDDDAAKPGIGELLRTVDNRVMVSTEDRVVVGLNASGPLNPGDRLAAIHVGRRVIHPITGTSAGRILYVLGLLEVTDVRDRVARARINYSCGPMGVGNRIVRFAPAAFPEDTTPQPTRRSVNAAVLDSLRGEALLGLQQYAFVDVGTEQGIAPGDVFAMVRPYPPAATSAGALLPIPSDQLGAAVVIRVAERSATVLLTASSREVRVGDQAVLSYQIAP